MQTTSRFVSPLVESPHHRLARLADGFLSTQLLVAAAELGLADSLADAPRTADDLAVELRADPTVLHRLLRGLAADGVLREHDGGRFGLTDTGELMRTARYGSQRGSVLARGRLYYAASTMICVPTSLAQEVGAALGAQAGEARLSEVIRAGGLGRVRRATETPFNMVLEARP